MKIIFLMLFLMFINSCAQTNNADLNKKIDNITRDPDYVGKTYKDVMDAEVGNVVLKGLNCYPTRSFTLGNKNELMYQSCTRKYDGKSKYFVFKNGIYENTIDVNEFNSKYLILEQQKEARKIEEERRAERLAEKEERIRIIELKNKAYSKAPANFKVQIKGSEVLVTSTDSDPFLLERIVINNRVGDDRCDLSWDSKYMRVMMGDVRNAGPFFCGGAIIKIDIFTNRGNSTYRTK